MSVGRCGDENSDIGGGCYFTKNNKTRILLLGGFPVCKKWLMHAHGRSVRLVVLKVPQKMVAAVSPDGVSCCCLRTDAKRTLAT